MNRNGCRYVYTYIPSINSASLILNILFLKNQLITTHTTTQISIKIATLSTQNSVLKQNTFST